MLDLNRVRPILVARQATRFQASRVGHQVDQLGDWIRHHGREPRYAAGNRHGENVMALRLHGYAVVLAGFDGTPPPPNPLAAAAPARRRDVRPASASLPTPDPDGMDQTYWAEGAGRPVRYLNLRVVAYPMGERDPTYHYRLGTVVVPFVDDLGSRDAR